MYNFWKSCFHHCDDARQKHVRVALELLNVFERIRFYKINKGTVLFIGISDTILQKSF